MNRTCRNCGLWAQAETGDWGACCRLSYVDTVLSFGDGFVRTRPDFGCVEFVPLREEEGSPAPLVLEGVLNWEWDEVFIGEAELGREIKGCFPDDQALWGKRYRFTIERLGESGA